ncbi:Eco57I restriction-modification methylase domain-containing protein [Cohnella suwonensis]|uniref:site-specific DNA-methyltransferase (adenine-specific) n=1 Tax=Cohnella suwonensis TaxID=696072 RepID=A0ABW0LUU9_9BACL
MQEKQTGSFYTPKLLVEYMSKYVMKRSIECILEPSFGDGRFLEALKGQKIDAVELDITKVEHAATTKSENVNLICANFVEYALSSEMKYDLVIGNPPYISKKAVSEQERELSLQLMNYWSLPDSIFQNLWVSFVLGSLKLLKDNGVIFFVLPFEFLQVHYAEKLRAVLEEKFNLIEITTFKESVFPDIEQDVCLVLMTNVPLKEPIVKYTTVKSISDFTPLEYSEIKRNKPLKKWSNAILNDDEIELLMNLSSRYIKVDQLGDSSPGIVTGANNFFILNKTEVDQLKGIDLVLPLIQKGSDLGGQLVLTSNDFNELDELNKKVWLLQLNDKNINNISLELGEYLQDGIDKKINKRYKCENRKNWYEVPIITSGDLMFFKRYNKIPKLVVNEASVNATDIAYNIRLHKQFDPYSVAFCFYNTLTFTLCEYFGRFYGGGVGELVPSEFKSLSIPYKNINRNSVKKLERMLKSKNSIESILKYVDNIVLNDLSKDELLVLNRIREKYLIRRLKITPPV